MIIGHEQYYEWAKRNIRSLGKSGAQVWFLTRGVGDQLILNTEPVVFQHYDEFYLEKLKRIEEEYTDFVAWFHPEEVYAFHGIDGKS